MQNSELMYRVGFNCKCADWRSVYGDCMVENVRLAWGNYASGDLYTEKLDISS